MSEPMMPTRVEGGEIKKTDWSSVRSGLRYNGLLIGDDGFPYEAENPMQEVRKEEIEKIQEKLKNCDVLVLGTYARTGASSVLNNLLEVYKSNDEENNDKENQSKKIYAISLKKFEQEVKSVLRNFTFKYTDAIEEGEGINKDFVIVVDEANALFSNNKNNEELDEEEKNEIFSNIKKYIKKARERGINVKIVFQSHDFYGENGEGGVEEMERWLRENILSQDLDLKTETMQLENIGQERMHKIFNILSDNSRGSLEDLIKRKDEIISLCTIPQQLNKIISAYIDKRASGKEDQEAYDLAVEEVKKDGQMKGSLEDIIRTTAGGRMRALLRKVALSPEGFLDASEFSEDERKIYDRYKMLYLFNENDGKVSISGKILEEHVKNYATPYQFGW